MDVHPITARAPLFRTASHRGGEKIETIDSPAMSHLHLHLHLHGHHHYHHHKAGISTQLSPSPQVTPTDNLTTNTERTQPWSSLLAWGWRHPRRRGTYLSYVGRSAGWQTWPAPCLALVYPYQRIGSALHRIASHLAGDLPTIDRNPITASQDNLEKELPGPFQCHSVAQGPTLQGTLDQPYSTAGSLSPGATTPAGHQWTEH